MTENQRDYYETVFRDWEKKSTYLVMILFGIIMIIHVINPAGEWKILFVRYVFRTCLILMIGFIIAEFFKDLFYPLIAKFDKSKRD